MARKIPALATTWRRLLIIVSEFLKSTISLKFNDYLEGNFFVTSKCRKNAIKILERFEGGLVTMRGLYAILNLFTGRAFAIFFAAMIVSSIYMCQSNVAEAGANIYWKTTSVSIEPGKAVVRGYFYNVGNATAAVNKFTLNGYIAQYKINVTYAGSNITVGYVSPGKNVNWTFTVTDRSISYYDSNPRYNFDYHVWWN